MTLDIYFFPIPPPFPPDTAPVAIAGIANSGATAIVAVFRACCPSGDLMNSCDCFCDRITKKMTAPIIKRITTPIIIKRIKKNMPDTEVLAL